MPSPFLKSKERDQEEMGLKIPAFHRQQGLLDLITLFCFSYNCFYRNLLHVSHIMVFPLWQCIIFFK